MAPINTNPAASRACGAEDIYKNSGSILSNSADVVDRFRQAMQEEGIAYFGEIIPDGHLHRIHIEGHRKGTRNGAYICHADGVPAGWFMDFTTGISRKWKANVNRMTRNDLIAYRASIAEQKRKKAIELRNKHEETAVKAAYLWERAKPATNHPYLAKKRIKPHGARQFNDALAIPLQDQSGRLCNLQFIKPDGSKRFLAGGKTQGCFQIIGDPMGRILIAEGFATGCSLHQETGDCVVIAFGSNNLLPVAKIIRQKYRDIDIIVCGDNDESGVGQRAANEAAAAVGGLVHIPDVPGSDWNDILSGGRHE